MLTHGSLPTDTADIFWRSSRKLGCETQTLLVFLHLPEVIKQQDNRNTVHPPTQMLMCSTKDRSLPSMQEYSCDAKPLRPWQGLGQQRGLQEDRFSYVRELSCSPRRRVKAEVDHLERHKGSPRREMLREREAGLYWEHRSWHCS